MTKSLTQYSFDLRKIGHYNIRDLQRHAIVRGMEFEKLATLDVPNLQAWVIRHHHLPIQAELLDKYDDWKEAYLKSRGMGDEMFHPDLRLGFTAEKDEEGNILKTKRGLKGIKKPKKPKTERTAEGLFTGTKKALTFDLVKKGLSNSQITSEVTSKFPEAKDKSITIWIKRARKQFGIEAPKDKPKKIKESEKDTKVKEKKRLIRRKKK